MKQDPHVGPFDPAVHEPHLYISDYDHYGPKWARQNIGPTARLALLLAAVAGFLDAVGYLTLHEIFTAHLTGNASKLGIDLARGHLGAAAPLLAVPGLFVLGVSAGTVLADRRQPRLALAAQAALVTVYMLYGSTVVHHGTVANRSVGFWILVPVATVSLGLQTAALTEVAGETTRTTYISGMLTRFAQLLVRGGAVRRIALLGGLWVGYVAGATAGAALLDAISIWCLAVPLAALGYAFAIAHRPARRRPAGQHVV